MFSNSYYDVSTDSLRSLLRKKRGAIYALMHTYSLTLFLNVSSTLLRTLSGHFRRSFKLTVSDIN